ncbi:glycosyltransferase family 1 protein [Pseudomonas sp. RIT-PI-AD]|uniref:glycosyltransferase family 4 protein n=1 Tax=Pseudomonas sp. RIT-PI-AD TaxID=3035294 RepID=UPI0021DA2D85|nr:glycosyltransferase family 1 protein [Pseudomonas sp. RIT-PI-AD]
MRLLIECTYVYDHPNDNSGIQRVVRNIVNNLDAVNSDVPCIPVILKNDKVYGVSSLSPSKSSISNLQSWLSHQHARLSRLRHRVWQYQARRERKWPFHDSPFLRVFLGLACRAFSLALALPQKALAQISLRYVDKARANEMEYLPGDVLVLLDSSWHADFFPVAERLKAQGVSIVSVIYDLIPLTHPQFCDDGLVRVFQHWFDWIARTADGFISISQTISDQVRQEAQWRLGRDVAAERWFDYFHLGSELDLINEKAVVRHDVKRMFKNRSVYLMVSTVEPRKNHVYLLDAFDKLWAEGVDVALCIVGKVGWKCEKLIERIKQHPELNRHLFMFNDLSDRELEYCYRNARSLVFPSYVEGFGLPLVEAMQRGLPAMASDIPVFREIGDDAMAYFGLSDPESLCRLVRRFESTGQFPSVAGFADWSWLTWKDSANQLIERVLRHTRESRREDGSVVASHAVIGRS